MIISHGICLQKASRAELLKLRTFWVIAGFPDACDRLWWSLVVWVMLLLCRPTKIAPEDVHGFRSP